MANWKCAPRKKRKDPLTDRCNEIFCISIYNKNYELAALAVFFNVLCLYAKKGILNALADANSYWIRKGRRRGLQTL